MEVFMPKQRFLPLCGHEVLEALWEVFPERSRRELVTLLAQLLQQAVHEAACETQEELHREPHRH
jgi:hypothetical protein